MKLRTGFVSNSSSSSFIAVGIGPDYIGFEDVLECLGLPHHGEVEDLNFVKGFPHIDRQGALRAKDGLCLFACDHEIVFIGVDATAAVCNSRTATEFKREVKGKLMRRGIKVPLSAIHVEVEEYGWG